MKAEVWGEEREERNELYYKPQKKRMKNTQVSLSIREILFITAW